MNFLVLKTILDIKQTVEFKLPPTKEPKTFVISKNGSPHPFVLNVGRWALHIKTKQRLYLVCN